MSDKTGIAWTSRTWNPIVGCDKVSPGCAHCYAETLHNMRHKAFTEGKLQNIPQYAKPFEVVQLMHDRVELPLHWRKPSLVFVNSMSDFFHDDVPVEFSAQLFATMKRAEQHTFQILTKRPENIAKHLPEDWGDGYPNVWLGVSVENQRWVERIEPLRSIPCAVRFVSCEPLLGPLDLSSHLWPTHWAWDSKFRTPADALAAGAFAKKHPQGLISSAWAKSLITWIIAGGESGPDARPCELEWLRALRDQCAESKTAFFLKQLGGNRDARAHEKAVLDGCTHTAMPRAA